MSSANSHLSLQDSIVRCKKRLFEAEFCCLEHKRKFSAICLLYKIYHRVDHSINKYLNHFVEASNTRVSAALGNLTLVIPR